ncbi:MAG: DUF3006 family protein [Gemmatimonadetes bacterium]|nr:DUF3006 family protein [Gemmatimonadota bacterium]
MAEEMIYTVDRLKDHHAVVVSDEGELVDLDRDELPEDAEEGSVLVVPVGDDGEPDWSAARLDEEERERRRRASQEILDRLRGREPGE